MSPQNFTAVALFPSSKQQKPGLNSGRVQKFLFRRSGLKPVLHTAFRS